MRTENSLLKQLIYAIKVILLLSVFSGCTGNDISKNVATIDLIIDEPDAYSASVTGKELLWSKSQIKWKDNNGEIKFEAHINNADLLLIKVTNSYKYLRCYLEAGQNLNVIFKDHEYRIAGNSIAARQNRLMIDIEEKRKQCLSYTEQNDDDKGIYALKTFKDINLLISDFKISNADSSSEFLKFINFDNKYAYLKSIVSDSVLSVHVNGEYKDRAQTIYRTVMEDSDYNCAYFSAHYRYMLNKTINYIRFNDSVYNQKLTINPVENEWLLASGLISKEMQAYQMAVSLKELFPIDCNLNLRKEISNYTGYWQYFLLDDYKSVKYRSFTKHNLNKAMFNHNDIVFVNDEDTYSTLENYPGKWIFIGIGRSAFGYSPFEASFLDEINSRLPEVQCFCVSSATGHNSGGYYNYIHTIFNTQDQLRKYLKTDYLPYSLLINPEGELVLVNLPSASSGMLEPMLRKLVRDEEIGNRK